MCQYFKPISISLSPNTEKDDVRLALKLLFQPWKWKRGNAIKDLEEEFKKYFGVHPVKCSNGAISPKVKLFNGVKHAISFNSGRSAFLAILRSLQKEGNASSEAPSDSEERRRMDKEVLLQAFTCNAAINPILWSGLQPVYVDCNEDDFNIDIEDLKRKITSKSKVVVVQHTFGLPANMDDISKICQENNLILIEDCAHSLGAKYKVGLPADLRRPKPTTVGEGRSQWAKAGTFGKAAYFSFSRDKIISSIYGGMAVTNDDKLAEGLRQAQGNLGYPSYFWIFQQLLHPILLNYIILPIYNFLDLGKIFLVLSQWLHILSKAVHWREKQGEKPAYFPKRMPNALALLVLNQFKKLERFNEHRKKIADFYYQGLGNTSFELPEKFPERENVFLRFTVKHKNAHDIIWQAWQKQNILIGDWYTSPIAPYDTKLEKIQYIPGACPNAEKLSKITFNLPTHINISPEDAKKIVNFLKIWS